MNKSKTPRTDDATLTEPYLVRELTFEVVTTDFARQLETELTASKAKARLWERRYDEQTATAALTAQERDASKAREERLATAMRDIANIPLGMLSPEYAMFDIASASLEAWRAAK